MLTHTAVFFTIYFRLTCDPMRVIVGDSVITCMPPPENLPENACRNARWSSDTRSLCESKSNIL